jgi:hypothetical protein
MTHIPAKAGTANGKPKKTCSAWLHGLFRMATHNRLEPVAICRKPVEKRTGLQHPLVIRRKTREPDNTAVMVDFPTKQNKLGNQLASQYLDRAHFQDDTVCEMLLQKRPDMVGKLKSFKSVRINIVELDEKPIRTPLHTQLAMNGGNRHGFAPFLKTNG